MVSVGALCNRLEKTKQCWQNDLAGRLKRLSKESHAAYK